MVVPHAHPAGHPTDRLLGTSPALVALRTRLQHLVRFDTPGNPAVPTLLLQGETGTGKSLVARIVHDSGPRTAGPFLEVNCAALPATMLEAELFGFEAGAFTDARRAKPGLFEAAAGGTLFLDEIDAVPLALQGTLLLALESKRVRRLGAVTDRVVDVKCIAATNADLRQALSTGRLRADLYHRLAVVVLTLPPLRERGEDVLELAQVLLEQLAATHGLTPKRLQADAAHWLCQYTWPGNVRELRHLLERVTLLHPADVIEAATLTEWCETSAGPSVTTPQTTVDSTPFAASPIAPVLSPEAAHVQEVLVRTGGNLAQAARLLGLSRDQLRARMRRYHLSRPVVTDATSALRPDPAPSGVDDATVLSNVILHAAAQPPLPEALPALSPTAPGAGERRQITVLCCALVDSTALANQMDPEDWQHVLAAYHAICAEIVVRFQGHVAQYLGDGVLVYFGYPQAQEDDALRAVRAGLALIDALQDVPVLAGYPPIQVRVGVHTGLVVIGPVGTGAQREPLAMGDVPPIAARLQHLATPGAVVLGDTTARLVTGYVVLTDLGPHTLHGVATPIGVAQVLGEQGVHNRLEAARAYGFTPFVGREPELALLRERWAQVQVGRGQVVLLSGEAGIGKSRLVQVVREQVVGAVATTIVCQCAATQQHSPFAPLIAALQRLPGLQPDTPPGERLQTLEQLLAPLGQPYQETVPLLAALLALPLPAGYASLVLTPQQRKQQTLEALVRWLLYSAQQGAVLLVLEDLHWLDPSTLEWLTLVLEQVPTTALYVVLTSRPEWMPPWPPRAHVTALTLPRLPDHQVVQMVRAVAGTRPLPPAVVQRVMQQTDGVPLFIEELTKTVLESGLVQEHADAYSLTAPLPTLAIPTTLQASLLARLDRLGTARRLAQLGATLGREFSYSLLRAVVQDDAATLQRDLRRLVDAELLYQRGLPPQATYRFKHALIQEAAYQTLLRRTRQQYHSTIADVLAERFPDTVTTQPELLAHHYTEAGRTVSAIEAWHQAGQRAAERAAYVEAITHCRAGLALVQTLPETPARRQQELALLLILDPSLMAAHGYSVQEVADIHARARTLCQELPESPQLAQLLRGLWYFHSARAEHQQARAIALDLLTLGQRLDDPLVLLEGHRVRGLTAAWQGDAAAARVHAEHGIALVDRHHHPLGFATLVEPGVSCRYLAAVALQALGYPAQALQRSQEALALAQARSSPYTLSNLLSLLAFFHLWRREDAVARQRAETARSCATIQGYTQMTELATLCRGAALTAQGQPQAGLEQICQALTAYQRINARNFYPWGLAMLAETYGRLGQPETGLQALAEAQILIETTHEGFYAAEIARLQGELLLQAGLQAADTPSAAPLADTAAACFQHALAIARQQHARWWELRAAMSLSRLWQRQGKCQDAYDLLAPVYTWFTEGFDTTDLQDAQALLGK